MTRRKKENVVINQTLEQRDVGQRIGFNRQIWNCIASAVSASQTHFLFLFLSFKKRVKVYILLSSYSCCCAVCTAFQKISEIRKKERDVYRYARRALSVKGMRSLCHPSRPKRPGQSCALVWLSRYFSLLFLLSGRPAIIFPLRV